MNGNPPKWVPFAITATGAVILIGASLTSLVKLVDLGSRTKQARDALDVCVAKQTPGYVAATVTLHETCAADAKREALRAWDNTANKNAGGQQTKVNILQNTYRSTYGSCGA
jgi:hypothetical protein